MNCGIIFFVTKQNVFESKVNHLILQEASDLFAKVLNLHASTIYS